jgi:hypothetical protein
MAKLPQTDHLPQTGDGYDPARVEEAFAAFTERVRELEAVAAELRSELRSLRAERVRAVPLDEENWPREAGATSLSPDWIDAVPPPLARRPAVPRLALEGAFLLLVALLAGLAELSATWIVLVMTAAWVLVALSEWAVAAKRARWRLDEIPPALEPGATPASDSTGPWADPVVQATVVEEPVVPEPQTVVTKLPAEPATDTAETAAPPPEPSRRRGLRLRRRKAAEPAAADPWEA